MGNYSKLPLKCDLNRIIIHVGTKDSARTQKLLRKNIIYIVKKIKNDNNEILLSTIVPRQGNIEFR